MSSSLSQWVWAVLINILGEKCCLVNKISVVFTCSNDINKRIPLSLVNQFPVCHYIEMGMDCFQYLFPSFVHVLQKLSQIQTLIGLWTNKKWGKSSTQIDKTICTRVWLIWNRHAIQIQFPMFINHHYVWKWCEWKDDDEFVLLVNNWRCTWFEFAIVRVVHLRKSAPLLLLVCSEIAKECWNVVMVFWTGIKNEVRFSSLARFRFQFQFRINQNLNVQLVGFGLKFLLTLMKTCAKIKWIERTCLSCIHLSIVYCTQCYKVIISSSNSNHPPPLLPQSI